MFKFNISFRALGRQNQQPLHGTLLATSAPAQSAAGRSLGFGLLLHLHLLLLGQVGCREGQDRAGRNKEQSKSKFHAGGNTAAGGSGERR